MVRFRSVVPDGQVVTMRYNGSTTLTSGALTFVEHKFRGASIFDPDFTAGGHQPLGHDEWSTLYGRYRVIASKITVNFANRDTTYPVLGIVVPVEFSSALGSGQTAMEYHMAKYKMMSAKSDGNSIALVSQPWISTANFKGDKGAKYDKDLTAAFGANPVQEFWYSVGVFNPSFAAAINCSITVAIEYKVQLYDRNNLVGS